MLVVNCEKKSDKKKSDTKQTPKQTPVGYGYKNQH